MAYLAPPPLILIGLRVNYRKIKILYCGIEITLTNRYRLIVTIHQDVHRMDPRWSIETAPLVKTNDNPHQRGRKSDRYGL